MDRQARPAVPSPAWPSLPGLLDRADALVADATIGGAQPNAADLQILSSIRLLIAHEDLRPGRDALPPVPAALPPGWLP